MKIKLLRFLKFSGIIISVIIVLFVSFMAYISITDYKPAKMENVSLNGNKSENIYMPEELSFISWNIGYCGLGEDMDFFYEGGKMVRPDEDNFKKYLNGIEKVLKSVDSVDFVLLQEVDEYSKRSYYIDQTKILSSIFPGYTSIMVKNYDVKFVPVPLTTPMGRVKGGIMSLSKYNPAEAIRFAYPLITSWPNSLFMLDRCFLVYKFKLKNKKELIVVNTHNSFFVKKEDPRNAELNVLKNYLLKESAKGNYIICGGDWNQNPPNFETDKFLSGDVFEKSFMQIKEDFMPEDWTWAYDSDYPTNRNVQTPYTKGKTKTTLIDYFLTSPNIKVFEVKTIPIDFEFSDHQPVYMKVACKAKKPKYIEIN